MHSILPVETDAGIAARVPEAPERETALFQRCTAAGVHASWR